MAAAYTVLELMLKAAVGNNMIEILGGGTTENCV